MTAAAIVALLEAEASADEAAKTERRDHGAGAVLGVRMGTVFRIAKEHIDTPLEEVERLLDEPSYEARMAAVSVLDAKARRKDVTDDERTAMLDLYLRRHDRIDAWDHVDRAAPWVVGRALRDGPRDVLRQLAASDTPLERRTAMTAPLWFIRYGTPDDLDTVYEIATTLASDPEPVVARSVGIALKHAGRRDGERLEAFLAEEGARLSAPAIREALAGRPADERERLRSLAVSA